MGDQKVLYSAPIFTKQLLGKLGTDSEPDRLECVHINDFHLIYVGFILASQHACSV